MHSNTATRTRSTRASTLELLSHGPTKLRAMSQSQSRENFATYREMKAAAFVGAGLRFSMLACRLSLLGPQPFGQGGLAIANSAPDFQERRSIAPHARFGEPRVTDAQTTCSLFGSEQALSTAYITP